MGRSLFCRKATPSAKPSCVYFFAEGVASRRVWLDVFEDFRPFFCPKNAEGVPAFLQVRVLLPKKRGGCGFFWAERFRRSRGKFAHFYYILLN